jgi:hypothetical protein
MDILGDLSRPQLYFSGAINAIQLHILPLAHLDHGIAHGIAERGLANSSEIQQFGSAIDDRVGVKSAPSGSIAGKRNKLAVKVTVDP